MTDQPKSAQDRAHNTPNILSCPFCGAHGELQYTWSMGTRMRYVRCYRCHVKTKTFEDVDGGEQRAIDDWNTRIDTRPAIHPAWRPTHRHAKRGGEYMVIGCGQMQANGVVGDYDPVTVYQDSEGIIWVRPKEEFDDGRFEEIAAAPQPPVDTAIVENDPRNTRLCTHPDCARYFSKAEGGKWFCRAEHCGLDHGFKASKPAAPPSTDEVIRAALEMVREACARMVDQQERDYGIATSGGAEACLSEVEAISVESVLAKVGK